MLYVFLTIFVLFFTLLVFFIYRVKKVGKRPLDQTPEDLGMKYDDVVFLSSDKKTTLKGWIIHAEKKVKANLIFLHGHSSNRMDSWLPFLPFAKDMTELGFRILTFDLRGFGESEKMFSTLGAKEKFEVLGAVDWIKKHYNEPIVLHGVSMGASTALLAICNSDDIKAVVADSPYGDFSVYLKENLNKWVKLPNFPFAHLVLFMTMVLTMSRPKSSSPIFYLDAAKDKNIFIIHGKKDKLIPYTESEKMSDKYPNFLYWFPENSTHYTTYKRSRLEYLKKVNEFYENALKG